MRVIRIETGMSESGKRDLSSGWEESLRHEKKGWILSSLPGRKIVNVERMKKM